MTLFVRGIASSALKAWYVKLILQKKVLRLKKAKYNLLFHFFPSVSLFLVCYLLTNHSRDLMEMIGGDKHEIKDCAVVMFLIFMCSHKFIKA